MITLLLAACVVPAEPAAKDPTTPADTDRPVDTDPALDTIDTLDPADPAADAARVRALIERGGDVGAVLRDVAWSAGWPVWDGEGSYLIVAPGEDPWQLAGPFNDWTPTPMTRADGFSWAAVAIASPWDVGYKLVLPGDGGAPDVWLADPWARFYTWDDNGRMSLLAAGSDHPHLERWPGLTGRGLAARDVDVWVPAGEGPWPLLVMHDGRNLFDPEAIWGGWRLGEALDAASGPVLVVGLDNTPDRMSEYTHAADTIAGLGAFEPRGDDYADLVALDVVPWAEATWSTDGRRGVMGSSLGGLISLYIAHRHPGTFTFAGSLSGTLGWGRFGEDHPTVGDLYAPEGHRDTVIYADSGGGPGEDDRCRDLDRDGWPEDDPDSADNYCETRQFVDQLAGQGYAWDDDLFHVWQQGAPHNEAAWASRVGVALERLLAAP
ncbi:MAG TPA: alpha/beta hydrolase-fold protein [Myxococcota bacterium]|nr:alpha/beta hydrolase-fold protein [Myxococcota bacterium]